jgi:plastocyanin
MQRRHRLLVVLALVPLVVIAGWLLGRSGGDDDAATGKVQVSDVGDDADFEFDYVIPPGTADRIAAGEEVEIVPQELVMNVGESIRIVNDDEVGHIVGVFYVGAGETLTQRFDSAGELSGECSVHPSGSFTLRVVEA